MRTIRWLHFTDFHQGMQAQSRLWPGVRDILFEDIKRLHERCGPWDLVVFTGDLTQRGSADEFARFNDTLAPLWHLFESLGSSPVLLTVPGNHDLVRPDKNLPETLLLNQWDKFDMVRQDFWKSPESRYRKLIADAFKNYTQWWDEHPFPRLPHFHAGVLPGDFAATLEKDGFYLGIVGLNSAFLQLGAGDYEGRLALDVRQFHGACQGDGPAWMRRHECGLLMTHHPPSWLSPQNRDHVNAEIHTPGRFAAHMFGHMHDHALTTMAMGAAEVRRSLQGTSLFGLEAWGEHNTVERRHGYAAGAIELTDDGQAFLRIWPRVARKHAAGHWRIIQDLESYELEDDQATPRESVALLRAPQPRPRPVSTSTAGDTHHGATRLAHSHITDDSGMFFVGPTDTSDNSPSNESRVQPPGAGFHTKWHIHRKDEEQIALNYLTNATAPVVLWGPEKFGKTWTLNYLLNCVHQQDAGAESIVSINFDAFTHEVRNDYNLFIEELAYLIVEAVGGPEDAVQKLWKGRGSANHKITRLLREHVLPSVNTRLVMALDRVDNIWGSPFKDDCFGMLRAWAQNPNLAKLRLILSISTTPSRLIDRPNTSPFNLTPPIVLGDFTLDQVRELAVRYGLHWSDQDFAQVMELIGGHPYLVRHVMHRSIITGGTAATELIGESTSLFDDFLARYSRRLHNDPQLLDGIRNLRSESAAALSPDVSHQLESAGLAVEEEAGLFRLRYRLYERLRL